MHYQILAEVVLVLHFAIAAFAVAGGLLVLRWRRLAWLHLPVLAWCSWVNLAHRVCPLTPLENRLRALAGQSGYEGGFLDHYLTPVLYPAGMSADVALAAGISLPLWNVAVYAWVLRRRRREVRARAA